MRANKIDLVYVRGENAHFIDFSIMQPRKN